VEFVSSAPGSARAGWLEDAKQLGRGFLMGGADIIPGVSGGTVALVLGIYARLVTALSRFDLVFLGHVRRFELVRAARHVDVRFLAALGFGIAVGIVSLANVMHLLLADERWRPLTLAAFFGLILASGVLVGRTVERWSIACAALALAGTGFALWITGLPSATVEPTLGYTFICGMIAICAMILPGISGAYILLLMGMYLHVTGAIKGLPRGDLSIGNLLTIAVFCGGCAVGLLGFSKLLRWLLARHPSATMATLGGFMIGSLRKIWPFKRDLTPDLHELKLKRFVNVIPDTLDSHVAAAIAVAIVGALLVFTLDYASGRRHGRRSLR
jgi:putative membrane protein